MDIRQPLEGSTRDVLQFRGIPSPCYFSVPRPYRGQGCEDLFFPCLQLHSRGTLASQRQFISARSSSSHATTTPLNKKEEEGVRCPYCDSVKPTVDSDSPPKDAPEPELDPDSEPLTPIEDLEDRILQQSISEQSISDQSLSHQQQQTPPRPHATSPHMPGSFTNDPPQAPRRGNRTRKVPERYGFRANAATIVIPDEPVTYRQATSGDDADLWQAAMDDEI